MTQITFTEIWNFYERMSAEERKIFKAWFADKEQEEEILKTLPNPLTARSLRGLWKDEKFTDEDIEEARVEVAAQFAKRDAE